MKPYLREIATLYMNNMFIAAYSKFPKYGKNLWPLMDEWLKKLLYTHIHTHGRMLFSLKKGDPAICDNMDDPEGCYAK